MKIKLILCLLCLFVANSAVVAQRGAIVRGLVSDELGGVIVGASVSHTNNPGQTQTTVTDANGNYLFNGIAAGTYSISVTQTGFATFQQATLTVVDGRSLTLNVN